MDRDTEIFYERLGATLAAIGLAIMLWQYWPMIGIWFPAWLQALYNIVTGH